MPAIPCQAVGCTQTISSGRFMCRAHWFALPMPLRQNVTATWRARQKASAKGVRASAAQIIAHVEACDEARRLTADREGRMQGFTPDADRIKRIYAMAAEALADD